MRLNPAEQKLAKYLAQARYEANRNANITDAKIGPQSNKETDLGGTGGEIAFCKIHNVYPDLSIGRRPPYDAILPTGHTVDVKTTSYESGCLAVRIKAKDDPADLYALMIGTFPEYRFVGWISKELLFRDENIGDLGHGPTYVIKQEGLS
jgi:hypothetical protein